MSYALFIQTRKDAPRGGGFTKGPEFLRVWFLIGYGILLSDWL